MFHVVTSGLWARKRRLLGTSLAIVLGVAFLAATLILGATMRAGFRNAFTDANAGVDVVVRSPDRFGSGDTTVRDGIDASIADDVAALPGVRVAAPSVEGTATILGADGRRIGGNGPPTIGTNWIADADLNPYRLAEGRAPQAPGEVVIDRKAATDGGLAVGATTTVLTPQPVTVTVVGIATFGDLDSFGPTTYTAFTLPQASELFAQRPDTVSAVLVAADAGVSQETLRDEIMQQVPAHIEALTQGELTAEQQDEIGADFLDFFEMILLAFAGIALVVATFSIHNTFSILVAQRTRESALLRALGASRRQVVVAVALEALAVGIVASAIGFGVGIGLAAGLQALMSGAGMALPTGLVVTTGTIVTAAVVGILTTLVASVAPAIKASRVAPLAALRDVAVDRSSASKLRAVVGLLVAGGGAAVVVTANASTSGAVARAGLGALLMLVGFVVLGPVVARPAAAVLGLGASATRGFTGRLARRNAMRNPRRIAGSAAALMVGTAVVAVFTTFGASVTASIDDMVAENFAGDLVITQTDFSGAAIDPATAPAIAELPEVDAAVGSAAATVRIDGRDEEPMATDPATMAAALDLEDVAGSMADVGPGEIAVGERYAADHDLHLGDVVAVTFVDGTTTDLVIANVFAREDVMSDLIMDKADWAPHAGRQAADVVIFVTLADGVSEADGLAAVAAVTDAHGAPEPLTRDGYVDSIGAQIDQMLFVVYGLLGIAILIAVMSVGNTLALSIHERTRELGLLRAVGQSRRQLRSSLRWESIIVAVFGTIGGLGLGTFLGWGLMRAMKAEGVLGTFAAPVVPLAVILGLAAVAGVLAARRPAKRAARMDVLAAIATD